MAPCSPGRFSAPLPADSRVAMDARDGVGVRLRPRTGLRLLRLEADSVDRLSHGADSEVNRRGLHDENLGLPLLFVNGSTLETPLTERRVVSEGEARQDDGVLGPSACPLESEDVHTCRIAATGPQSRRAPPPGGRSVGSAEIS